MSRNFGRLEPESAGKEAASWEIACWSDPLYQKAVYASPFFAAGPFWDEIRKLSSKRTSAPGEKLAVRACSEAQCWSRATGGGRWSR